MLEWGIREGVSCIEGEAVLEGVSAWTSSEAWLLYCAVCWEDSCSSGGAWDGVSLVGQLVVVCRDDEHMQHLRGEFLKMMVCHMK